MMKYWWWWLKHFYLFPLITRCRCRSLSFVLLFAIFFFFVQFFFVVLLKRTYTYEVYPFALSFWDVHCTAHIDTRGYEFAWAIFFNQLMNQQKWKRKKKWNVPWFCSAQTWHTISYLLDINWRFYSHQTAFTFNLIQSNWAHCTNSGKYPLTVWPFGCPGMSLISDTRLHWDTWQQ